MIFRYLNLPYDSIKLNKETVVVLGIFDGVHTAHMKLFNMANKISADNDLLSVVYTFDKTSKNSKQITDNELKKKYIEKSNIDMLVFQKISENYLSLSPEIFADAILKKSLKARTVVVGENYTFGKNATGNCKVLKELGSKYGFEVKICPMISSDGTVVSSTSIRELLTDGKVELANKLLGRKFEIYGDVQHGNHIGNTIGFPTVNIYPNDSALLPKFGVYLSEIEHKSKLYKGITNIGIKPTVENSRLSVETFIKSFDKDIYGENISVRLIKFIRPEKKFSSIEELKNQINRDLKFTD